VYFNFSLIKAGHIGHAGLSVTVLVLLNHNYVSKLYSNMFLHIMWTYTHELPPYNITLEVRLIQSCELGILIYYSRIRNWILLVGCDD
jgi:hypothetical protein